MSQRGQILHDERMYGETEQEPSPHLEAVESTFLWIAVVLVFLAICLIAGITWGLLERFYPSTACMIMQLFSSNCK
jgi:hypothetical protein